MDNVLRVQDPFGTVIELDVETAIGSDAERARLESVAGSRLDSDASVFVPIGQLSESRNDPFWILQQPPPPLETRDDPRSDVSLIEVVLGKAYRACADNLR